MLIRLCLKVSVVMDGVVRLVNINMDNSNIVDLYLKVLIVLILCVNRLLNLRSVRVILLLIIGEFKL